MKKDQKVKFGFILLIIALLGFITFFNIFHSEDTDSEEKWIETAPGKQVNSDENDSNSVIDSDESEAANTMSEESDTNKEYIAAYGKDFVKEGKKASEKVVEFYLEQESEEAKWNEYSTSSFFDQIKDEIQETTDGINRKVVKLKTYAVGMSDEEMKQGKMKFEVNATWKNVNGHKTVGKSSRIFYTIVDISKDNKCLVEGITML